MNNSNLSIFEFESNEVRILFIKGEIWFVAKDVCRILGLSDTSMACAKLREKDKGTSSICTPSGEQQMIIISEFGLYELVLSSRKKEAKQFKYWLCDEVIPSIRKQGSYSLVPISPAKAIIQSLQLWEQQQEQILAVQAEQQKQSEALIQQAVQIEVARVLAEQNQATIAIQQQKIDSLEASLDALRAVINQPLPTCQQTKRQRIVETMQLIGRVIFERKLKPTVPEAMREAWVLLTSKIKHSSARKDLPLQKANMERAYTKAMEDWKVHGGVKPRKKDYFLTYGELIERNKIEDEALSCANTLALQLL